MKKRKEFDSIGTINVPMILTIGKAFSPKSYLVTREFGENTVRKP